MNKSKIIFMALIVSIMLSYIYILIPFYEMYDISKQSTLLEEAPSLHNAESSIDKPNIDEPDSQLPAKDERMLKLEELQKANSEIIAWIEIANTKINFPVLQASDNNFYLYHDYTKKKSKSGAIFLDKDYVWSPPSSNLLIYGHNMNNGTMFEDLLKYKNKEFYNNHPIIKFTTTSENSLYEIISVFKSKVYYKSDNVFKYYRFINAETESEYNDYITNIKKLSLYDTGKTAVYGEQLMTLSTCSYHTKDGRFVVVAKKIDSVV